MRLRVAVEGDIGIGMCAGVVWRGWNRKTAWQGSLTCGGSLVRNARFGGLTSEFWRKSPTKRSLCRLEV